MVLGARSVLCSLKAFESEVCRLIALAINERRGFALDKYRVIISSLADLDSVQDPRPPPLVKAPNSVPRKQALTSANHPQCEPARSFLRCSVDGVGKTGRAWIKLMDNGVGHVVLLHCRVHTLFDVLPAERKSANGRMPQEICNLSLRESRAD